MENFLLGALSFYPTQDWNLTVSWKASRAVCGFYVQGLRIWIPKNMLEERTVSIKQTRWSGPKFVTCLSLLGEPGRHAGKNPDTCAIWEVSESGWWHEMFGLQETKISRIEGSPDTTWYMCMEVIWSFFQVRLMNPSILDLLLWGIWRRFIAILDQLSSRSQSHFPTVKITESLLPTETVGSSVWLYDNCKQ